MRHGKTINHLGRTSSHRKAMLSNMASSLILHKRITTTVAKAKALRTYVEPLITKSKEDSTHSRRTVFSYLQSKEAVNELFREVSTKVANRPGGYTRILKTGTRLGDSAEMCFIELVDYNENMLSTTGTSKSKSARRRRGSGKKPVAQNTTEGTAKPAPSESVKTTEKSVEETPEADETAMAESTAVEVNDEASVTLESNENGQDQENEDNKA